MEEEEDILEVEANNSNINIVADSNIKVEEEEEEEEEEDFNKEAEEDTMVEEGFNKAEEAVGIMVDFNKVDSSLSKVEEVVRLALILEAVTVEVAVKINKINNSSNSKEAVVLNKEASNNNSHNSKVEALHEGVEEEAAEAGGFPTKAEVAKVTQLLIRETCLVRSLRLALDVDLMPIPACTTTFVN
jgi:hypothetical protein